MKLEDLQQRIKQNKQKSNEVDLPIFDQYLNYYNIKSGIDRIPTYLLYYVYSEFIARNKEELPLSRRSFSITLKKHISPIRWGKQRYSLIDKSTIKIDQEMEFKAALWQKSQTTTEKKT